MNHFNYRRRINGTRIHESSLPSQIRNISKIDLSSKLRLKNQKDYSLTSEELNHYLAFTEEEANEELRRRRFEDEEAIKLYLDNNTELKNIVTTLVDSCIVYDKYNQFCSFTPNKKIYSYTEKQEELLIGLFSKHLKLLNFNREQEAWSVFYDWICSGKVNYEIIYKTITRKEKEAKIKKEQDKIKLFESKIESINSQLVSLNESKKDSASLKKIQINKAELVKLNNNKTISLNEIKRLNNCEMVGKKLFKLNEDSFSDMYERLDDEKIELDDERPENIRAKYKKKTDKNSEAELIPVEIVALKRLAFNSVTRVDVIGEDGENVPMYKLQDFRGRYSYLPQECIIEIDWGKVSGNSKYSYK